MDQIVADGVAPVLARVFGRIPMVELVPATLPEAEPVGIIEPILRRAEMVKWPVADEIKGLTTITDEELTCDFE